MKSIRILSVAILVFVSINAIVAGFLFIIDPSGAKLGISTNYLINAPFNDFFIPGLFLFFILGLGNLYTVGTLVLKNKFNYSLVLSQGLILCTWIIIQIAMIKEINFLHILMFVLGTFLVFFSFKLKN